eukprot:875584_1
MLPSTTSLLMVFGIILLVVIASITKKAIPIIRSKDFSHCYIKLYLDVLLQTIVLGGSLSASVMLTDNTLEIPTTSSATIVILFSLMNILLICLQFIYSKVEKRVRSSRQYAYENRVREVRQAQLRLHIELMHPVPCSRKCHLAKIKI